MMVDVDVYSHITKFYEYNIRKTFKPTKFFQLIFFPRLGNGGGGGTRIRHPPVCKTGAHPLELHPHYIMLSE